jgi:isoquinoline 1-oxidoreductase beta subunit
MGKWSRRAFITIGVLAGGAVVFGVAIRRGNPVDRVSDFMASDDETMLNVWLKIGADNSTTIFVPHAEMGQGIHTTLPMMLADELDANWDEVSVIEAPAHKEYAAYALARGFMAGNADIPEMLVDTVNGFFLLATQTMGLQITGGSTSVQHTGELAMRVGGASARAVLLSAAAEKWNVDVDELETEKSHIIHAATSRRAPYSKFAADAATLTQSPTPNLKRRDDFKIMGTSVPRVDIPAKVDGTASFGIDVVLPGMKYATVMAAPVFGSVVLDIDSNSLANMQGVHKVINLDDAVVVVADGYWTAKKALEQISITWSQTANAEVEQDEIFNQFSRSLDTATENGDYNDDFAVGDVNDAFSTADLIVESEYRVPYLAHATMEPMNCTAWSHDGQCELWLGTQNPLGFAKEVATALDIDADNVVVHNQYLGGGFGRRAFGDIAVQAARIANAVAYPVKLIWSREEDMRHDHYRQASISRFKGAIDAGGRPTAWLNQYVEKHDPADAPHIPYSIDNQLIHYADSPTHVPWGFWRSVDNSLHGFFKESFIDELAIAAGKDPYEYRRELLADQPRFRDILDLAAAKAGWGTSLPDNVGRGIAITKSFGSIVAQVVEAEIVNGSPKARRVVCAVDAGYAMHPDGMAAQMESGIIYGLTAALYGDISIRRGAVMQSNFHDYKMLRMNEAPMIETHIINGGDKIGGAGEPATPAIAPALANAIFDATGIRVRELPMSKIDFSEPSPESLDVV